MRNFKKRRYILAFLITIAIFFLGFFFGFVMDLQRVDYFTILNEKQKLDLRSIQLQYELVKSTATENQCNAFRFVFDNAILELEKNRARLESYTLDSKLEKENFNILRREYTLSQINFWQISEQLKSTCPSSSDFVTIIYFFSDTDTCKSCDDQAAVLDYYKAQLKENVLIFAIDEKFESEEPVISLLKNTYDITEYPTLIIEGDKYSGLVDDETMNGILCNLYSGESLTGFLEEEALYCD